MTQELERTQAAPRQVTYAVAIALLVARAAVAQSTPGAYGRQGGPPPGPDREDP